MTEEIVPGTEPQTEQVELSPTQAKALEQGWRPKDQFDGPEDEFIDAAEFVRRGELFSKIEHQSKELKAVKRALDELKSNSSKIREQEYERALTSLKAARRQAFTEGETDRAFAIEDQIEQVQSEKAKIAQEASTPAVQELNPEFVEWQNANAWYSKDRVMRAAADAIGLDYAHQGKSPREVLKLVAEEIRKEFPNKFSNPKGQRAGAVESSTRGGAGRGGDVELSDVERTIMKKLVARGDMTEAEYKKQIKEGRGA